MPSIAIWIYDLFRLLVKYGPTAYKIITEIDSLIDWLRSHDEPEVRAAADNYATAARYELLKYKREKDPEPLREIRDELRTKRAERESLR